MITLIRYFYPLYCISMRRIWEDFCYTDESFKSLTCITFFWYFYEIIAGHFYSISRPFTGALGTDCELDSIGTDGESVAQWVFLGTRSTVSEIPKIRLTSDAILCSEIERTILFFAR